MNQANIFGAEFWAALFGALVAGIISYGLQRANFGAEQSVRARDRRQEKFEETAKELAEKADIAMILLTKINRIHSNVIQVDAQVHGGILTAIQKGVGPSAATLPFSTDMSLVEFTDREIGLVKWLRRPDLLNDFLNLSELNKVYVQNAIVYRNMRDQLHGLMSSIDLGRSGLGSTEFRGASGAQAQVTIFQANMLLYNLYRRSWRDVEHVNNLFFDIQKAILEVLGRQEMGVAWSIVRMTSARHPLPRHGPL